jgi:hypothetical protein
MKSGEGTGLLLTVDNEAKQVRIGICLYDLYLWRSDLYRGLQCLPGLAEFFAGHGKEIRVVVMLALGYPAEALAAGPRKKHRRLDRYGLLTRRASGNRQGRVRMQMLHNSGHRAVISMMRFNLPSDSNAAAINLFLERLI